MLVKTAHFIREKYSYLIVSALIVGAVIGFYTSSPGMFIRNYSTILMIIMIWAMSLTIRVGDFLLALKNFKGFSSGVLFNFALAPVLCWILATAILHNYPDLATGLILIGVVPCAGIASRWGMEHATSKSRDKLWDYLVVFPSISAIMAMLLMFMVINTSIQMILKNTNLLPPLVVSTILVFPIMFGVARLLSKKLFDYDSSIAITYSPGMKNLPIAMGIAITSFGKMSALPIAVSFIFQMVTAVGFYRVFRNNEKSGEEL